MMSCSRCTHSSICACIGKYVYMSYMYLLLYSVTHSQGTTSTCDSSGGQHNLAPYSFFNAFNYNPPIIGFSSIGRKHTLRNIQATSCFTWNLANITLADKMNKTSDDVACDVSEFEHAGLTPVSSLLIAAPRVAESPVSFECKVTQIVQLSDTREDLLETWRCWARL